MTPIDRDEALSCLLGGDLPDDEARAWQERIASDPDIARAWAEMQALTADLEDLPLDGPPAHLDAAVLGGPPGWRRLLPWAVAAVVLVGLGLLGWSDDPAKVVLGYGAHTIDGEVRVVVGDVVVDVHGRSRIGIAEPPAPLARGPQTVTTEGEMKPVASAVAGAVGGAVVTVAVMQGTAVVHSGTDVHLDEGEQMTVPSDAAPMGRVVRRTESPGASPPAVVRDLASAKERIAELEAENEALRLDLGIASGQLSTLTGEPQSWPDDVPEAFRPDPIRARFESVFERFADQAVLTEIDCSEYPCIALVESPPGRRMPEHDELGELTAALTEGLDEPALMIGRSAEDRNGEVIDSMGVVLMPEQPDADSAPRTDYRLRTLMESAGGNRP